MKPHNKQGKKLTAAVLQKQVEDLTFKLQIANRRLKEEITSRQTAEAVLEKESNFLKILFNFLPDTIYFKDANSRFIRINRAHARALGLHDPEEVAGKTDFDFFPREHARQAFKDEQEILRSGKAIMGKLEDRGPQHPQRWIMTSKVPLYDDLGHAVGLVGISRDVTDLREAELALEQERILLQALMENMPDAIYFKNGESKFISVSTYAAKKFGALNRQDVVGKTDADYFSYDHAQSARLDEIEIVRTGRPIIGKEERETWPARPDTWVSSTKMPLLNLRGDIIGTFGISRDITEVKNYEAALQQTKKELASRVAHRTQDLTKANEHLKNRVSQLNFLTTASYELAQYTEIDELYPAIVRMFLSRFTEARAALCIRSENNFRCTYATGTLDNEYGRSAAEQALQPFLNTQLQQDFIVPNWKRDDHLDQFYWPGVDNLECYIAIPLLADNTMLGCIQIFTGRMYTEIYDQEKPLLTTLAATAAVCQSSAAYQQKTRANARVTAEVDAARDIQKSFMPRKQPQIPNVQLKGVYYPAYDVGGDYLDYFKTTDGYWIIVIADVCGKGIPAALLMTHLRSTFRFEAQKHTSARDLMCAVNLSMSNNLDNLSFVTAASLVISPDGNRMTYSRAGHPPLIRMSPEGSSIEDIECDGLALGLTKNHRIFCAIIQEKTIDLIPGDRYFVFTDGLNEAMNQQKEQYGMDRLKNVLSKEFSREPADIIDTVMGDIKDFTKGATPHDDLTMLALCVSGD